MSTGISLWKRRKNPHIDGPNDKLCEKCIAVPFDAHKPPFGDELNIKAKYRVLFWKVGTIQWIQEHPDCPLCRILHFLLIQAVQQGQQPSKYTTHDGVRKWLSTCANSHGKDCNPSWSMESSLKNTPIIPDLDHLLLIDVFEGCLVEVGLYCKYIALSYVWGQVSNFRLTTINKSKLMRQKAFHVIWYSLPRTIRDAIDLVRNLGGRYLWVDAMCLTQNDQEATRKGMEVMDFIYERALLTIVASSGNTANSGLPGVQETSRWISQKIETIAPGVQLAVYIDFDNLLKDATYSNRAWTFQEQLLSRRGLFFLNGEVYFRCRESTWSENTVHEFDGRDNMRFLSSPLQTSSLFAPDSPSFQYRERLHHYTQRALTDQGDALLAMTGIIRRISDKMKCTFLQGIPTAVFDQFMLFQGDGNLHR
ncbi:heterokaryon incompatibility protein-domain-containing protein [Halenospora varia]|nr:heterokaryon incompatibility protein-domain-containing protein [Halenospora varia]